MIRDLPFRAPAGGRRSLSHRGAKKGREVPVRINQFSAIRKAGSRQLVAAAAPPLPEPRPSPVPTLGASHPRTPDDAAEPSKKDGSSSGGVEVSRVRKGCESSSCLCSCTLWCLRGPFVSDYDFLSPVCSFSASVQGGRKERRRAHTGGMAERDADAGL